MGSWDPSFFRRSPLFWPIAGAAAELTSFSDWPSPEDLTRLFDGDPPVRFVRATRPAAASEPGRPRRRRAPLPADARYDARIALEKIVSTRDASWHDLLNALVWTAFPRAKMALHVRQHRMITARLQDDLRLPGARTREQDAVAMLDEGGVVVVCPRERQVGLVEELSRQGAAWPGVPAMVANGSAVAIVFGHALYEGLARGGPTSVRGAAYVVGVEVVPSSGRARVEAADRALADLLSREPPIERTDFGTIAVEDRLGGPR